METKEKNSSVLRVVNPFLSVRKGKNGKSDYLFYKPVEIFKPKFISLANKPDYLTCSNEDLENFAINKTSRADCRSKAAASKAVASKKKQKVNLNSAAATQPPS